MYDSKQNNTGTFFTVMIPYVLTFEIVAIHFSQLISLVTFDLTAIITMFIIQQASITL